MPKPAAHQDVGFDLSKLEDSMQSMQRSVFERIKPLEASPNHILYKVGMFLSSV